MSENDAPKKFTRDNSGASKVAIDEFNKGTAVPITVRQIRYLNNIVEQDHHAIRRLTRPMLGFKWFRAGSSVLARAKFMHMIHRGISKSMVPSHQLPTSSMRWRDWSVQRELARYSA